MNSVLIIDDDKELCALMKKCVEQENLSAVVAHGGLEGLRLLEKNKDTCSLIILDVMMQLIKVCGLPVERYFNPEIMREESEQRQRVSHKLKLCPEEYLPIIEGAIDGALKMEQTAKQKEDA